MKRPSATRKPKTVRRMGKPARPSHIRKAEPIEVLTAAMAKTLALPIEPAWRAGVAFNLQLILAHAKRVDEFSPPDGTEPAPVFHA